MYVLKKYGVNIWKRLKIINTIRDYLQTKFSVRFFSK